MKRLAMKNRPRVLPQRIKKTRRIKLSKRKFKSNPESLYITLLNSKQIEKTIAREYYKTPLESKSIIKELIRYDKQWCLDIVKDCVLLFQKIKKDKHWHKRLYREISYNFIYKFYDLIEWKNRDEMRSMQFRKNSYEEIFSPHPLIWVYQSDEYDFSTRLIIHRISYGDTLSEIVKDNGCTIEEIKSRLKAIPAEELSHLLQF
jgi:hypothetical protein